MCYSAMVKQECKKLGISFNARIDLSLFDDMFKRRAKGDAIAVTKGLEHNFLHPESTVEKNIKKNIDSYHATQVSSLEQELFALKKRLADAERKLKLKPTKTAEKEKAVAERQIERKKTKLENITRTKKVNTDDRIYPFNWTTVIVQSKGERLIVPMRYHLRPQGKPPSFDEERPGCYNARRDNLTRFWRKEFGHKHGVIILTSFFENVDRHVYEKRELKPDEKLQNVILHFKPRGVDEIVVPIIWDAWEGPGEASFQSFAIVTDELPLEVSQAGHDRCPIFIKPENIDAWLNPEGKTDKELFAILDDRIRPYYEHEVAA